MKEKEEPVYVGIADPIEIRRALLESSKSLIKILQENESRREKRASKHRLIADFKETMKDLTSLMVQMKSQLPKVRMSSLPKKPKPAPVEASPVVKPHIPKPRPVHLSETQKLEKELKDIEDKLSKLG